MARHTGKIFIHPQASIDPGAVIGKGTRVWQYTVIKKGASIGENCNIGSHCYVEWGVKIGNNVTVKNGVALWEGLHLADGVFVGPNAVFTNDLYPRSQRVSEAQQRYANYKNVIVETFLEYASTIGAGAMILAGVTIGRFSTVGLGAVVLRSVPPYAVVAGNPAVQIGWICECGLPLSGSKKKFVCSTCSKQYQLSGKELRKVQ